MPTDDRGVGLIEVVITALVGSVILTVVASVFITTLQSAATTRDRDFATGRVQAISTSLSTAVRTADAVSASSTIARVRIPTGTDSWECHAWAVVDLTTGIGSGATEAADGDAELRTLTYAPLTDPSDATPQPDLTWGALTDRVDQATNDADVPQPYFSLDGERLTWHLAVVATEDENLSDGATAQVSGSAVARGVSETTASEEAARCW
ncbi:hypothetical protein [Microbacterium sediminicola]